MSQRVMGEVRGEGTSVSRAYQYVCACPDVQVAGGSAGLMIPKIVSPWKSFSSLTASESFPPCICIRATWSRGTFR